MAICCAYGRGLADALHERLLLLALACLIRGYKPARIFFMAMLCRICRALDYAQIHGGPGTRRLESPRPNGGRGCIHVADVVGAHR